MKLFLSVLVLVFATPAFAQEPLVNFKQKVTQADPKAPIVGETTLEIRQAPDAAVVLAETARPTSTLTVTFLTCVKAGVSEKTCLELAKLEKNRATNSADETSKALRPQIQVPYSSSCLGCVGSLGSYGYGGGGYVAPYRDDGGWNITPAPRVQPAGGGTEVRGYTAPATGQATVRKH